MEESIFYKAENTIFSLIICLFQGRVVALGNDTFPQKDIKLLAPSSLFSLKGA
jgi:hypothetical protein